MRSGRVVALGWNKDKNNPRNVKENFSVHAEIDVLKKTVGSGGVVYIARAGGLRSEPCLNCQKELKKRKMKWLAT